MTVPWAALLVPAWLAGAAVLGSVIVSRRLRPQLATRLLTILAVAAAGAVLWALVIVVLGNVVQLHGIAERVPWCNEFLRTHTDAPTPVGLAAFGLLAGSLVAAGRARRLQRTLRAPDDAAPLAVLPIDRPTAFALPGRPGQIVVSRGMLESLDPDERRVLVAHERAHLEHRHHRYLRASELAATAVPVLRPLADRVRFATERWADEEAVRVVGDRRLVARALARAALAASATPAGVSALGRDGVLARVDALLQDEPRRLHPLDFALLALVTTLALVSAGSAIQVHHWLAYLLGLCAR